MSLIFDTHAHYDDEAFDEDRESLLAGMAEHGIGRITNVGASLASSAAAVALSEQYSHVYAAVGVHPDSVGELNEDAVEWLKELALQKEKVVAIGEIGLDYHWDVEPREVQKQWFRRQLELARTVKLPVIIHSRDAAQDTFDVLKQERAGELGGVIHCYSGSPEMAKEYIKMGFYIGVGGVLTFKNSRVLKEVVKQIPLERIVLETDCPYLAPTPYRGKRNSSLYLPEVVRVMSELTGVSEEEVIRITWENANRLYGL